MLSVLRPGITSSRLAYQQSLGRNVGPYTTTIGDTITGVSQVAPVTLFTFPARSSARESAVVELLLTLVTNNSVTLSLRMYIAFLYTGGVVAPSYQGNGITSTSGAASLIYGGSGVAPTANSPALYGFTIRDITAGAATFSAVYTAKITYFRGETTIPTVLNPPRSLGSMARALLEDARMGYCKIGPQSIFSPVRTFAAGENVTIATFPIIGATMSNVRVMGLECLLLITGNDGTTYSEVRNISVLSVNGVLTLTTGVSFGGGTYALGGPHVRTLVNGTSSTTPTLIMSFPANALVGGTMSGYYRMQTDQPLPYADLYPSISPLGSLQYDFLQGLESNGAATESYSLPSLSGIFTPIYLNTLQPGSSSLRLGGSIICMDASGFSASYFRIFVTSQNGVITVGVTTVLNMAVSAAGYLVTLSVLQTNGTATTPGVILLTATTGGATAPGLLTLRADTTIVPANYSM